MISIPFEPKKKNHLFTKLRIFAIRMLVREDIAVMANFVIEGEDVNMSPRENYSGVIVMLCHFVGQTGVHAEVEDRRRR